MKLSKMPTCIDSLDLILDGGLPSASLVTLIGETGAGDFEFLVTTIGRILNHNELKDDSITLPKKVCYISLTRSKDDILREIAFSFPDSYETLKKSIKKGSFQFKDFSEAFFARSMIPDKWRSTAKKEVSFSSLKWNSEETNLIEALIEYLDTNAKGKIVIIDSLTALAQHCMTHMKWSDYIVFLYGLQRASKKWDGFVYALLKKGIFEEKQEEEILECMDGAIFFEWEKFGSAQRRRIMYLKKFRGLLPGLDQDNIVNFETQITPQRGFEVSNIKKARGI